MKLNKMTLAAVVTFGLLASTNAGFTQDTTTEMSETQLAACPLSGCSSPVTPQTATCPKCHQKMDSCTCKPIENECNKVSDDCNQCPPIAQCPTQSDPTCAVCPQPNTEKKAQKQTPLSNGNSK